MGVAPPGEARSTDYAPLLNVCPRVDIVAPRKLARAWPKSCHMPSISAEVGPELAFASSTRRNSVRVLSQSVRALPNSNQAWTWSGQLGPSSAESRRKLIEFVHTRPGARQSWPDFDRCWKLSQTLSAKLGPESTNSARLRSSSIFAPERLLRSNLPKSVQNPNSAKFGRNQHRCPRSRTK